VEPAFFRSAAEFRRWLSKNHSDAREILVGFHKKQAAEKGITYPEALDEALCFGWIDGIRRSAGDSAYTIRFSPRKNRSIWSAVNIRRAKALEQLGRMAPAGLAAFRQRDEARAQLYSYERGTCALDETSVREFQARPEAWAFFAAQPPSYRRVACWYVMSAKKEETRRRRLLRLIDDSARGQRVGLVTRPARPDSA
jgi:uncharacterized protein YdeI (YjbR/CyaY-like superfamily)